MLYNIADGHEIDLDDGKCNGVSNGFYSWKATMGANGMARDFEWFRQKRIFAPNGQSRVWRKCLGAKNQFLFEMVQKGPEGPKRVPNDQKHLG